ncbi:hypothetical protein JCM19240_727 [Vibrio maritimus]|uniref:O-antigen ligase-related domain-containing protein n=1 Tax=Vibrio maritimus TaxID=990268 RepID=A0A090TCC1_9VIBR|nr:hypothetical protein JCM19240_727 [Vibrio maritimus]
MYRWVVAEAAATLKRCLRETFLVIQLRLVRYWAIRCRTFSFRPSRFSLVCTKRRFFAPYTALNPYAISAPRQSIQSSANRTRYCDRLQYFLVPNGTVIGRGQITKLLGRRALGRNSRYIAIILLSLALCQKGINSTLRGGVLFLAVVSLCALIATGSRGPMLFFFIALVLLFAFNNRKLFWGLLVVTAVALLVMKESVLFHSIYERVASIFANDNASNNARLLMWSNALGFIEFNIQHHFSTFLFGTGDSSLEALLTQYLSSVGSIEEMQKSVNDQMSINDFHNLYLDSAIRMGAIFTLAYLSFIGYLLLALSNMVLNGNKNAWMSISLIVTYLGIGTVYSNNLEFQTAIFFFLLALCITWPNSKASAANS